MNFIGLSDQTKRFLAATKVLQALLQVEDKTVPTDAIVQEAVKIADLLMTELDRIDAP